MRISALALLAVTVNAKELLGGAITDAAKFPTGTDNSDHGASDTTTDS
jgi:hypothetical protein